jgi:hypothetical protein
VSVDTKSPDCMRMHKLLASVFDHTVKLSQVGANAAFLKPRCPASTERFRLSSTNCLCNANVPQDVGLKYAS